jgi:hypothetical protein
VKCQGGSFTPFVYTEACYGVVCPEDEHGWVDGTLCGLGTTCNNCKNEASYWWSKIMTACGEDTCWGGGTLCAAGTSCNQCCSGSAWSWSPFGQYCN